MTPAEVSCREVASPADPPQVQERSRDLWRFAILIAAFLVLVPAYYLAWVGRGDGLTHDDGIYMVTAKALATGQGYSILSLPDEIRQTKYPVLFPFLLSLLWRVNPGFPANIPWLKLLPLLATLAWLAGAYRLARELSVSVKWALLVTACLAANPWVVSFSGLLRPENLFGALITWAIVFLCRAERNGSLKSAIWACCLLVAAYHTRTAAVAVIVAGFAGLVLARRIRLAGLVLVSTVSMCLPWILWQSQQQALPPAELYYTALCYRQENILSYFAAGEKAVILGQNFLYLLTAPALLFGFPGKWAGLAASLVFWSIFVVGLKRTGSRCLQAGAVFSLLMPVLWSWPPYRFLFPAAGLMLLAVYNALRKQAVRRIAFAVMFAAALISLWPFVLDWRRTEMFGMEFRQYPVTWSQFLEVQHWIRAHASPGDVVVSSMDPAIYLYTGLKSIRGYYIDALPIFYDLPAQADYGREFRRVLARYHPKYFVRLEPDYADSKFLDPVAAKLTEEGRLTPVYGAGALHVYGVHE
jgi:hypothetical protein